MATLFATNYSSGIGTASISNAYATGQATGTNQVGGLVGSNNADGGMASISNAYAIGPVTGSTYLGGLVGFNYAISGTRASISNAYASGQVSGSTYAGGLIGYNHAATGGVASISNAYWDPASTTQAAGIGFTPAGIVTNVNSLASSNRYQHASYAQLGNWTETASGSGVWQAKDTNNVAQWIMLEGSTRPFLASEYSTVVRNAHQLQLMAYKLGAGYTLANDIDASATFVAGANAPTHSGMWSTAGFVPLGNGSTKYTGL